MEVQKERHLLKGNCLIKNVIYKCTVSPTITTKQWAHLGLANREWKQWYDNHMQSFRNAAHKKNTALSSYLWELKKNVAY